MVKYELIALHGAGTFDANLTPHGAERAKVAGKNYADGNCEYIVCLGDGLCAYRNFILNNFPVPKSRILSYASRSSFQEVFILRDCHASEGNINLAATSNKWHIDPRLKFLYDKILSVSVKKDFIEAIDPRSPQIVEKDVEREKLVLKADALRLRLPFDIGRSNAIEDILDITNDYLRKRGTFWNPEIDGL